MEICCILELRILFGEVIVVNTMKTIERIARENKMTVAEAEREKAMAIRAAMNSPDPRIRERWKEIAPDGREPTVEEFLRYCAKKLK